MYSPKKNNIFIKNLLLQPEGLHLDFKQGLSNQKKIAKTLLSFANTEGGEIIVGVSDDGRFVGIDPEEEMFMITEAIKKYCHPVINISFEVYEFDYDLDETFQGEEKYLLIIHVPKSNEAPHFLIDNNLEPVFYLRIEDKSLPSEYIG